MARIDVKTLLVAAFLTIFIFVSIYALNLFLEEKREEVVSEKMNEIIEDFEEIETAAYLMEFVSGINKTYSCEILKSQLEYLESKLWKLDLRIRGYREITKDFANDKFYIREKKILNRREIIHLSMLKEMKQKCNYNQTVILYFYGECEKNRKCDDQGFVLTYINQKIDHEIAIFSFDADLNVSSVNTLINLYNVTEYPCVVIEDHTECGMHDKREMEELLCGYNDKLSICGY